MTRIALVREQVEDREVRNYRFDDAQGSVTIITTDSAGPYAASGLGLPTIRLKRRSSVIPLAPLRNRLQRFCGARIDLEELRGVARALSGFDIACVNELHNPSSAQAVRAKAHNPNLRVVTVCYENIPFNFETIAAARIRKDVVRRGSDQFVALTEHAARALRTEGVDPLRIHTLTYGVDLERFESAHRRRAEPGKEPSFLYAGRLLREKGLAELLVAFAKLPGTPMLTIAGDGPERQRLDTTVQSLGLQGRVTFVGWVAASDMSALYASADVFVLPSLPCPYWEEQLGFSLIEAMASGLPIVSTTCGSIRDVVGDAGLLVPAYDTDALTRALDEMLDPALRAKYANLALARARANFDADSQAKKFAMLFQHALEQPVRLPQ